MPSQGRASTQATHVIGAAEASSPSKELAVVPQKGGDTLDLSTPFMP